MKKTPIDGNIELMPTPAEAAPKKKVKKSARFADDQNIVHEIKTDISEEKYPERRYETNLKSKDGDIPLEKAQDPKLSPEEELSKFLSNFVERSSEACLVLHLRDNNKNDLEQYAADKEKAYKRDSNREDEEYKEATGIKNSQNLKDSLSEDELSRICEGILRDELKKVENKELVEKYSNAIKNNMKAYVSKMKKNLTPKINDIIDKTEKQNPFDPDVHLDVDAAYKKWQTKRDAAVYNEFKAESTVKSKVIAKASVKFYEKLSSLCKQCTLEKAANYFTKKAINAKANSLKLSLQSNQSMGSTSIFSAGRQKEAGVVH